MKWQLLELSSEQINFFADRFQISPMAAQVFLRRGITQAEEIRWYLDSNIRTIHNPFLFNDMENSVERINQAIAEGEAVMVFGDRDVDGITSAALLVRKLTNAGLKPLWQLPMENSHYGLTLEGIQTAKEKDVTLIITVDCGITNLDEIDAAVEAGIDVIVIDHHNPQDELPAAITIINPKVEGESYPFAGLSAAALVAKLNWALDFSNTPLYGEEQCLINIRPGNESLIFEAVRLRNMVELSRLSETIVENFSSVLENRVLPFIQGVPLFVYDKPNQMPLLRRLFGNSADIFVTDIAEETWKTFPDLKGRSLLRMISGSRIARFSSKTPLEIDVLKHLTLAVFQARIKEIYAAQASELSIVALSLIADMMPMRNENRISVRLGLESLNSLKKGGLHELLKELGLVQPPMSLRDIGWRVTPVLNSSGRMGKPDVALKLLLSDDPSTSHVLVKELLAMNEERKKHGDQAWKKVAEAAKSSLAEYQDRFIVVRDDSINRGITGILAGRLSRDFNIPAMVLAQVDGHLVGSVRTARGVNVTEFLSNFSDILLDWGGHDAAGGFYLPIHDFDQFKTRLASTIGNLQMDSVEEPCYTIDLEVPKDEMTENLWKIEEYFAPFGQESPPVLYCTRKAVVKTMSLMGKEQRHVRLSLDTGKRQWPAVFWDCVERVNRDFALNDTVDIVFKLEKNTWGQNSNLQLNIVDIIRSAI